MYQIVNDFLFNKQLTTGATALLTIMGSLLVAFSTAFLTRNKFKAENLWNEQKKACNTIVSQIRAARVYGRMIEDGFSEDVHRYYESDNLKKTNRIYWDVINIAIDAFEKDYLILPSKFRRRYEAMICEAAQAEWESGPDAYLTPIYAHNVAATDLLDIAVVELGIGGWWHRNLAKIRILFRGLRAHSRRSSRWIRRRYRRAKRWANDKLPWLQKGSTDW
ncbi:MAG TPA: hypothetical protein VF475_15005 [Sphingobium sp.]